ncbi:hypothetical protein NOVOSPHI9U_510002 [Novosphingobium sp. 9U]|nr:hypothetical protein NOVOSPHI9U_510002 [Novosphingobium sp. 9U]
MAASDQRNHTKRALAPQGPFSNRAAFVKPCCSYFARITVLYAVGIGRRNIWSGPEAQVLQGPQRVCARGAPKAPIHAVTYTSPEGDSSVRRVPD